MSPHAYTENQLVEQPAIGLSAALGWQPVSAMEETFGAGSTLDREPKGDNAGLDKVLGQNHQFLGVNNAIASMLEARKLGHGRGGDFWQTQGSGKSFSMAFFAQKVLRKLTGNWTFVVVTDRVELDEQIAKTFKTVGALSEAEGDVYHAASKLVRPATWRSQIFQLLIQNLRRTRHLLLPRLLSGQIDVEALAS